MSLPRSCSNPRPVDHSPHCAETRNTASLRAQLSSFKTNTLSPILMTSFSFRGVAPRICSSLTNVPFSLAKSRNNRHKSATVSAPRSPSSTILTFSYPEYRLRLRRRILRTMLEAVGFLVFLAIVSSHKAIVTDGENLPSPWLPICPIVSDVTQKKLWTYFPISLSV
jgi:hypothetical protein